MMRSHPRDYHGSGSYLQPQCCLYCRCLRNALRLKPSIERLSVLAATDSWVVSPAVVYSTRYVIRCSDSTDLYIPIDKCQSPLVQAACVRALWACTEFSYFPTQIPAVTKLPDTIVQSDDKSPCMLPKRSFTGFVCFTWFFCFLGFSPPSSHPRIIIHFLGVFRSGF